MKPSRDESVIERPASVFRCAHTFFKFRRFFMQCEKTSLADSKFCKQHDPRRKEIDRLKNG